MSALTALQEAIFGALDGTISCPVYDFVPQNSSFPYVTIAFHDLTVDDFLNARKDEDIIYFSVWSDYRGQKEILDIMDEMEGLLHEKRLPLSTGRTALMRILTKRTNREPDGVTYMGQLRLRVLLEH